jgi:preprotein translocase subunit SecA
MSFLTNLFSPSNQQVVEKHSKTVERINALEKEFEGKSQDDLKAQTTKWKEQLAGKEWEEQKELLNEILPEAFAAVREAAKRTIGQRHYDVQLIGGIVLHNGEISEMKTGEGKTLVATLPMYLNALAGRGVHLVTVNEYLARWQASWMGQIYHYLGLSVASIQHEAAFLYDPTFAPGEEEIKQIEAGVQGLVLDVKDMRPISRKQAYAADITYGTNNEYGFDYLRDNMVYGLDQMVQRELHYAIVDEVDSILIDEARTPLIISAPDTDPTDKYYEFAKAVQKLVEKEDYEVDEKHKAATLTDAGMTKLEKILNVQNLYNDISTVHHIENALRARTLFKRDVNYVVKSGEIIIVDEFTGRMMYGRRYSEGLHQAIEAKEDVKVQQESKTLATITFQNYFRIYHKLSGMTGTAETEAEEFHKIYKLEVVQIPTNKPNVRKDHAGFSFQKYRR